MRTPGRRDALQVNKRKLLVAWAAGFIDGEGCFLISAQRQKNRNLIPQYVGFLSVEQKDPSPLYILQALWGGSIRRKKTSQTSFASSPYHYEWCVRSFVARDALIELLPFLQTRVEKAKLIILLYEMPFGKGKRDALQQTALYNKFRELKILASVASN